jgi:hypothetical protein
VLFLGALCAALPSHADTIIETGAGSSGPSVNAGQFESQGWTQTKTYDDASIYVALLSWTPGSTFNITAYLTNAIGPLATSPTIASNSITGETPADSPPQTFPLFSGLTLGPGTYYLTLSSTDVSGAMPGALWPTECISGCPKTLDSGVTLLSENYVTLSSGDEDSAYAPASNFQTSSGTVLNFTLTDPPPSSIPEPETFRAAMIGIAGLLSGLKFRYRNRSPR